MDSLTEKIDQLLVSHSAFRALEVCESEGDWRENTEIQSFPGFFLHSLFLCNNDFQSETIIKAGWHMLNNIDSDQLTLKMYVNSKKCH